MPASHSYHVLKVNYSPNEKVTYTFHYSVSDKETARQIVEDLLEQEEDNGSVHWVIQKTYDGFGEWGLEYVNGVLTDVIV